MATIAERGSRALEASSDLGDLLRLAHEAVHRLQDEVHGETFEDANGLSRQLQRVRRQAATLQRRVEREVRNTADSAVVRLAR
ncbi:MAG: hypothetical protein P8180_10890 [Gammaproteobacteria bacterium]|jgi:hypothetical protein